MCFVVIFNLVNIAFILYNTTEVFLESDEILDCKLFNWQNLDKD